MSSLGQGRRLFLLALSLTLTTPSSQAITLEELRQDSKITPKSFAAHFSDFRYEHHEEIQPPEVFLATRSGDNDDYATLADLVFTEKGAHTRLIEIRLAGLLNHVVCYIVQDRVYLDYSNRQYLVKTERCTDSVRDIANKVAKSLNANWTTASEFTYRERTKTIVSTVVKTESSTETAPSPITKPQLEIDF